MEKGVLGLGVKISRTASEALYHLVIWVSREVEADRPAAINREKEIQRRLVNPLEEIRALSCLHGHVVAPLIRLSAAKYSAVSRLNRSSISRNPSSVGFLGLIFAWARRRSIVPIPCLNSM